MGCTVLFFSITTKSGHWLQSTEIKIKRVTKANIFSNSSSELLPETPADSPGGIVSNTV